MKGLIFTLQTVAQSMIRRGKGGKIINFASQAGRRGEALVAVYCASGGRSQMAAQVLISLGYREVHNIGGLFDWQAAGGAISR